jgi:hypothetical protein
LQGNVKYQQTQEQEEQDYQLMQQEQDKGQEEIWESQ